MKIYREKHFFQHQATLMWYILATPHPSNYYFHSSLTYGLRFVTGSYRVSPLPLLQNSLTHFSSMFDSDPPPLPTPLALTQAYCSLSAAQLNSDCWLEVETEKEALGVFIETLSFTRTITTLPHRENERQAKGLLVSHLRGSVHTRTHSVLLNKVTVDGV